MSKQIFNALVLHRVLADELPLENFEDIHEQTLKYILNQKSWVFSTIEEAQRESSDSAICLTFDDGNTSDIKVVLPQLLSTGNKATFFIITSYIDTENYLTSEDIVKLHRAGMQIGSHSHTHPDFRELGSDDALSELIKSKEILERIIGTKVTAFSFPFGFHNKALDQSVLDVGYSTCLTSDHGFAKSIDSVLPRNSINSSMNFAHVKKIMFGSVALRISWVFEDILKSCLKYVSPSIYRRLRNFFVGAKRP